MKWIYISEKINMLCDVSMAFGVMIGCVIPIAIINGDPRPERVVFAAWLSISLFVVPLVFKSTRDYVERL